MQKGHTAEANHINLIINLFMCCLGFVLTDGCDDFVEFLELFHSHFLAFFNQLQCVWMEEMRDQKKRKNQVKISLRFQWFWISSVVWVLPPIAWWLVALFPCFFHWNSPELLYILSPVSKRKEKKKTQL